MNPQELAEARQRAQEAKERAEGATPGLWHITPNGTIKAWLGPVGDVPGYYPIGGFAFERDNEFAINAREDVPDLAGLVDALVGEVERLKKGYGAELSDVEAELAPALGYVHDEEYGWVVGDHTSVTLAMEARQKIGEKSKRVDELEARLLQRDMKAAQLPFPRKEAVERIVGLANDFMRGGSTTYLELKEAIYGAALSGGKEGEA